MLLDFQNTWVKIKVRRYEENSQTRAQRKKLNSRPYIHIRTDGKKNCILSLNPSPPKKAPARRPKGKQKD
ncbi:hypothetical protein COCCADRAFT_109082 [Bipolaris zeicola 26-R-13]|uniref:Uncharacterized protein n=1 Tax=Cochliobolus carbonum (strain 26-R-13) TaxID=930089 RepID=W6YBC2_COCC2|nr:uncharacterized protein COCCADRAFT_109082 [Bipolaris zeicola 26-R-13]EUC28456.1 hypothetical protein COCCADRAFT_109082 [Bipolaris zeicola 26-R-13]